MKLTRKIASIALLGTLGMPIAGHAGNYQLVDPLEDGLNACGVPVCSVDSVIETLGGLNENQRYNYMAELAGTYKDSKDPEVLRNLLAASKELKKLCEELGDADWVIRAASTLGNNAVLNLSKYSEIKADTLIDLYRQLDTAATRYEVIAHYLGAIETLEDSFALGQLAEFGVAAQDHSLKLGDEDWIPRAAAQLASNATIKLVALNPAHEGVYQIQLVGAARGDLPVDKIVALDSSSSKNLVVNFINSNFDQVVYSFSESVVLGNQVTGKTLGDSAPGSAFAFTFDRETGELRGHIETTRRGKISFEGQKVFGVEQVFAGAAPRELDEGDVIGRFEGTIHGTPGVLIVKSFERNVYSASFVSDSGILNVDYAGKFFPKRGVLSLTNSNRTKLVLALRATPEKVQWRGVSFSVLNGSVVEAAFEKLD